MKRLILVLFVFSFAQSVLASDFLESEVFNLDQKDFAKKGKICGGKSLTDEGRLICLATYQKAAQFCAEQGGRLPTVREAARWAVRLGIADIRHTAFEDKATTVPEVSEEVRELKEEGFQAVTKPGEQGSEIVDFYYNGHAFKNYVSGNEGHGFWTSTPSPSGWTDSQYIILGFESEVMKSINFEIKPVDLASDLAPIRCVLTNKN